jgi:hypothetical protein
MKSLLTAVFLLFASSSAFAGSCPLKTALIDKALSSGNVKNAEQVKVLRDKGDALHSSGDHGGSVAILKKAMKLGGIKG